MPRPIIFPLMRLMGAVGGKRRVPAFLVAEKRPFTTTILRIVGVTKDSTGAPLAGCTVDLFRTIDNVMIDSVVSDASGNYVFTSAGTQFSYYIVAYKAGAPDVAGTTVNTLLGA